MRLIANTGLYNAQEYGTVTKGHEFDCTEDTGRQLVAEGKARKPALPKVLYETKVVAPVAATRYETKVANIEPIETLPPVPEAPEVSTRHPFRDVPLLHEEPADLAPEGDRSLPLADLPESRDADPGRRRGRERRSTR